MTRSALGLVALGALLVGSLAVTSARGAEAPTPSPFSVSRISVAGGVGLIRIFDLDGLNDALDAGGYGTVESYSPGVSLAGAARLANGLVIEPEYRFAIVDNEDVTFMCHHGLLNFGWLTLEHRALALVPFLGVGFGMASLDVGAHERPIQRFEEVLAEPSGEAVLTSWGFVLHPGLSLELWGSGGGDFIGLRTGITWAPVPAGWKRRGVSVTDGPIAPMSTAYFTLTFGFRSSEGH